MAEDKTDAEATLVDPMLAHGLARLSTGALARAYDEVKLAKLQDDLGRDLGRLEGRRAEILTAKRESARDGTIKLLGWAIAILSFGFGFADILVTRAIGALGGLSFGLGIVGLGVSLLMDRREDRRQRTRNRALEELRQELTDLTVALARVRAARFLRPLAPDRPEKGTPGC